MKKLVAFSLLSFVLVVLLGTARAESLDIIVIGQPTVVAGDYCASCPQDDATDKDLACEDLEGTYRCGTCPSAPCWTEDVSRSGCSISASSSHIGSWPCSVDGKGDYAVTVDVPGGDDNCYVMLDLGAEEPTIYFQYYFVLDDEGFSDGNRERGFAFLNAAMAYVFKWDFQQEAGIGFRLRSYANAETDTCGTHPVLAEDTVYRLRGKWVNDTSLEAYLDGGAYSDTQICNLGSGDIDDYTGVRYFRAGIVGTSPAVDFQLDNVAFDETAYPDFCDGDS